VETCYLEPPFVAHVSMETLPAQGDTREVLVSPQSGRLGVGLGIQCRAKMWEAAGNLPIIWGWFMVPIDTHWDGFFGFTISHRIHGAGIYANIKGVY